MKDWADNLLTEEERWAFDTEGYLLVENALSEEGFASHMGQG